MEIKTSSEIHNEVFKEVHKTNNDLPNDKTAKKWISFDEFMNYHQMLAEYLLEKCDNKTLIDISTIQMKFGIDKLIEQSSKKSEKSE